MNIYRTSPDEDVEWYADQGWWAACLEREWRHRACLCWESGPATCPVPHDGVVIVS